ncbi:MAG: TIGR03790 family protein [Gammaproteobacteria bacterium]|nr:MAG: TIGR03790 family protein [Gammaproteobacteria bacterium]
MIGQFFILKKPLHLFHTVLLLAVWSISIPIVLATESPLIQLPGKISAQNVLVLYKQHNALSKQIAKYYAQQRHVPSSQVVPVDIWKSPKQINQQKFETIYNQLEPHLTDNIKVILLTWHAPYRVDCMSITSAFALGFDKKYCSHRIKEDKGCKKTANSPYFNSSSHLLWQDNPPIRLSMMLSGENFEQAKRLIDRGIAADSSQPSGTAYLVRTHDGSRSTRWPIFEKFSQIWGHRKGIDVLYIDDRKNKDGTQIQNKENIMFYHTGLTHVPAIKTNNYLPGAIADHLTSGAGIGIKHTGQMKAFRWLEAGVTGSYGAVVEPCNFPEKFPNPQVLIPSYLDGDSLIEAYWKSVQQPGEGLFVGEPLARPWGKTQAVLIDGVLTINSFELDSEKTYFIEAQQTESSPWNRVKAKIRWHGKEAKIRIPNASGKRYRIVENLTVS